MDTRVVDDLLVREVVPATFRQVFAAFPTGVAVIASLVDMVPLGMTVSSLTSVSLEPPLASVCVGTRSETWPALRRSPRIGVSVLGQAQQGACRQLAARGVNRFAGLAWTATADGAVLLDGAVAWFDCSVRRQIRAGDHDLVLLSVHGVYRNTETGPLVFHDSRFRSLAN